MGHGVARVAPDYRYLVEAAPGLGVCGSNEAALKVVPGHDPGRR